MKSLQQQLFDKNPKYYRDPVRLQREAEALGRMQRAMTDPLSPTKGNALAAAMNTLGNNETVGGVTGSRIKEDLAFSENMRRERARLSKLSGNELNDELKRKEAMMPRRI
jgi:hypothetical protein